MHALAVDPLHLTPEGHKAPAEKLSEIIKRMNKNNGKESRTGCGDEGRCIRLHKEEI